MNPDLIYLQKILVSSGNCDISEMETNYQQLIKQFSPAYLAGSKWYVGPSLTDYLKSRPLNKGVFGILCYLSHKSVSV